MLDVQKGQVEDVEASVGDEEKEENLLAKTMAYQARVSAAEGG